MKHDVGVTFSWGSDTITIPKLSCKEFCGRRDRRRHCKSKSSLHAKPQGLPQHAPTQAILLRGRPVFYFKPLPLQVPCENRAPLKHQLKSHVEVIQSCNLFLRLRRVHRLLLEISATTLGALVSSDSTHHLGTVCSKEPSPQEHQPISIYSCLLRPNKATPCAIHAHPSLSYLA